MADGKIIIDTLLDPHGLEKGLGSIDKIASNGLKVFAGAVVAASTALTGMGLASIKLASDLEEVQNVVDVTFGSNSEIINSWAKDAASAFGMSELQAKKFNGTMGAMLKSMGLSDKQVLDLSTSMTGLAGDFASFYNLEHEEAFDKIRSGISGETEPLKQLGINMSVANLEAFALTQGINKQWKEMSQAEQALLRYNYLMSVSSDAQGDFARTSDSLANQMRIAKLNMQSLSADIGKLLLPIAQEAMKSFNEIGNKLREAFSDPKVQSSIIKLAEGIGKLLSIVLNFIADALPKLIEGLAWICDNSGTITAGVIGIGTALMTMNVANMIMSLVKSFQAFKLANEGATISQWLLNAAMAANPIVLIIGLVAGLVAGIVALWVCNEDFRNFWIEVWENVKVFFEDCWNSIMTFFTEKIPGWINSVIEWFEGIPQWFSELPYKIGYAVGEALASLVQWGVDCYNWVTTEVPKIIDEIINWFSQLPGRIGNFLSDSIRGIATWGSDMYDRATKAASDTVNGIIDWFSDLPGNIYDIGVNIVKGLWDGITGMGGWLKDKVTGFCSGLLDGFLDFFDINSPSRVFRDIVGTNLVKGIGVGINVEMPKLTGLVDDEVSNLTNKLKATVDYETSVTTAKIVSGQNVADKEVSNSEVDDSKDSKVVIEVPVIINGKEVAKATAPYQNEFEKWKDGRI